MHTCQEAFAPYHVIPEEKKNTGQGILEQFQMKKRIKQQQRLESAVDAVDLQTPTSVM